MIGARAGPGRLHTTGYEKQAQLSSQRGSHWLGRPGCLLNPPAGPGLQNVGHTPETLATSAASLGQGEALGSGLICDHYSCCHGWDVVA